MVYTITFYLQFWCIARYLKPSNDTSCGLALVFTPWSLTRNIHRLGTTKQIFIAVDYLILMSEKCLHFIKGQEQFFPNFLNWILVLWKYVSNYVYLEYINKNMINIRIIQFVSKLKIFLSMIFSESLPVYMGCGRARTETSSYTSPEF